MATVHFSGVSIDAGQPELLAQFWGRMLGREARTDEQGRLALPAPHGERAGYAITFVHRDTPKLDQNRTHFDLTSASEQAMEEAIALALELGGRRIDIGQTPEDGHEVLADPEGNELCIIEPGNQFLAGTGPIGAINCDGSQALGYFWSRALDWPLVWDDTDAEETAIQSPGGGSKITWSGPPLMPRRERDRLRLEVHSADGVPFDEAVAWVVTCGATLEESVPGVRADLRDPDGNEFVLRTHG